MDAQTYLDALKAALASDSNIAHVTIVHERASRERGFFRAKLDLTNGDFLEVAEFFVVELDAVRTLEYRYQWMDASRQALRRRWDNAAHHRELPTFPDHVHIVDDGRVEPSHSMSIIELLRWLNEALTRADY